MLSKIYYVLGAGVIALYLLGNLVLMLPNAAPRTESIGVMRMDRGKYVPTTYSSGGSSSSSSSSRSSSSSSSSSRSSSYPSSGGYSGGK